MSGFEDVDATGACDDLAAYLDAASAIATAHKRGSIAALGLPRGDRALDVGCGLGDEVRLLADAVEPNGTAFGVDLSEHLLEAARARHRDRRSIRFIRADAHRLPFADRELDGARVERTLQHVANPVGVVGELARTVRPGRRIVAFEPDWYTLVFTGEDIGATQGVVSAIAAQIRHPAAGRCLPAWIDSAGLVIERFEARAIVIRRFALADQLMRLGAAVDRSATASAFAWREELRRQDVRGTFAASITSFMIVASVPGEQPG